MKLIIEIPENRYKDVIESQKHHLLDSYAQAVANGTPLEQMIAEIESAAEYQDTYVNADIAIGMYKALEYVRKYKGDKK